MVWAFAVVATAYYTLGYWLTHVAFRYVDPHAPTRNFMDIYDAKRFLPEGESARRRAIAFWWGGLPIVVVVGVLAAI